MKNGAVLEDARFFPRAISVSLAGRLCTGRLASLGVGDDLRVAFRTGGKASLCLEGSFSGFSSGSWRVSREPPPPAPWRALSSSAGFSSRWGLSSLPYSEAPRRWGLGLVLPTPSFFRFCLFPAVYSWSWQRGRPAQSPLGRGWSGVPIVPPADSGCLGGRGRASWSCRCAAEEKLALAGLALGDGPHLCRFHPRGLEEAARPAGASVSSPAKWASRTSWEESRGTGRGGRS